MRIRENGYWLIVLLIFFFPFGCGGLKSENEQLKIEVSDINAENDRLKREMNEVKAENSQMHVRLAKLNFEISALQNEILNLQKDLDAHKAKSKELERKGRKP